MVGGGQAPARWAGAARTFPRELSWANRRWGRAGSAGLAQGTGAHATSQALGLCRSPAALTVGGWVTQGHRVISASLLAAQVLSPSLGSSELLEVIFSPPLTEARKLIDSVTLE